MINPRAYYFILGLMIISVSLAFPIAQCDNYLAESGQFDYFRFQNVDYFFQKNTSLPFDDECYNDFEIFHSLYPYHTNFQYIWGRDGAYLPIDGIDTPVNINATFNASSFFSQEKEYTTTGSSSVNMTLCNSTGYCVGYSANRALRFYNNKTLKIHADTFLYCGDDKVNIKDMYYGATISNTASFQVFLKDVLNSKTLQSYGVASLFKAGGTPSKFYAEGDLTYLNEPLTSFYPHGSQIQAPVFALNNNVFSGNYITGAYINWANTYLANLVSSGNAQLIKPKYQFVLNELPLPPFHYALYYPYNLSDYTTRMHANQVSVVVDEFGQCFFVPAYNPSNSSLIYTLTGYPMICDAQITNENPLPYVPLRSSCMKQGELYDVFVEFWDDTFFEEYVEVNGNINYSATTTKILNKTVDLSEIDKYTLKTNGVIRCEYNTQQSSVFGILPIEIEMSPELKQLAITPLFLIVTGLSFLNPFIFVFNFALNDMFNFISTTNMFFFTAISGIFSIMFNWQGERSLKTLVIFFLLGGTYVIYVHGLSPYANAQFDELNNLIESFNTLFRGIQDDIGIIQIITIIIPTFLIDFVLLLLKLPAIIISLILASIGQVAPPLASFIGIFEPALVIGAYAFILLKMYEIGRNMFRPI